MLLLGLVAAALGAATAQFGPAPADDPTAARFRMQLPHDMRADAVFLLPNMSYPGIIRIHQDPPVYIVENFVTPAEAREFFESAKSRLFKSNVMTGPTVGGQRSDVRTSSSAYLDKKDYSWLHNRVAMLTRKPVETHESVQMTYYEANEHYHGHPDSFEAEGQVSREALSAGGQRIGTVLIYMNEVREGGTTSFPVLGVSVKPKLGRAIIFFPGTADGYQDPLHFHAADSAVDTKVVAQVWLRQRDWSDQRTWHRPGAENLIPTPLYNKLTPTQRLQEGAARLLEHAGYSFEA